MTADGPGSDVADAPARTLEPDEVVVPGAPVLRPAEDDVAAPAVLVLVLELDDDDDPGAPVPELVLNAPVALEVEPDAADAFLASLGGGAPTAPPDAGRFAPETAFSPARITNG